MTMTIDTDQEPLRDAFNSYEPRAHTPAVGSTWLWEPDIPHACEAIEVLEVKWNGEEWWVKATSRRGEAWNDLGRFWEACVPRPDPNDIPVGGTIRWRGRPSFAKSSPRWSRTTAGEAQWSLIAPDTWLRTR